MKPAGIELSRAGCPYLGTPYSKLDCQAFVEKALADIGLKKNLPGSNAWYRFCIDNGWTGTPEECKSVFGSIPAGAFLFILSDNGKEPAKYQGDGIGNASHIGIFTGMTGREMCDISGVNGAEKYNYGDGAIHSSSSRGAVCTSKFAGKSISGGWNRIGLWRAVSYGEKVDKILDGGDAGGDPMIATVWAASGNTVNMREQKSKNSDLVCRIPIGEQVEVLENGSDWCFCRYGMNNGYIMSEFLIFGEVIPGEDEDGTPAGQILVDRAELEKAYDILSDLLGLRG